VIANKQDVPSSAAVTGVALRTKAIHWVSMNINIRDDEKVTAIMTLFFKTY
jgi:hypothetical protein